MRLPSGLNAALYTASSWPLSGSPIGLPLAASQIRAVLSIDAVTMRLPSGLNAALHTASSWPLSGSPIGLPLSASQTRAVLSEDAVTMRLPSGLNAALITQSLMAFERLADRLAGLGVPDARRLVRRRGDDALAVGAERRAPHSASWPLSGSPIGLPVAASQIRAVLSEDAVTMRLPSGLNAALYTASSWPLSGSPIGLPVAASQIRAVLSQDAVTMRLPSGLNAALVHPPSWPLSGSPIGLPRRGVPDPRRLVRRGGDDALAVGAERGALHSTFMAFERLADRLAARSVPDARVLS